VWHSQYLDQQEADDLAQAIETAKNKLQALKEQALAKQEELDTLKKDYTNLTGESYEIRRDDTESSS
jgi:seryl-tRNA synthetase